MLSRKKAPNSNPIERGEGGRHERAKKRWVSNRVGCKARVVLKIVLGGGVKIHLFEERHTHS